MSRFFIDRPVFAWVLAIILMMAGAIAITVMPVSQYPTIAPPQISITVTYPGASADTVQNTVVAPIEQDMSGLDHLEYMSSTASSNGQMEIDLTFAQGTSPDIAQVQVQNKLSLAESDLPSEVTQAGITVAKATKNFLMIIAFVSTDHSMTGQDIADYVASNVQPELSRVNGVGDYTLFGSEYAMRIWLDPAKMYSYAITAGDVETALQTQNVQVSSGEIGALPAASGQKLDATVLGPARLNTPSQFENIVMKVSTDGSTVLLKDIAKVELGAQTYNVSAEYNGAPAGGLALKLTPGANQLSTDAGVHVRLDQLAEFFPPGLKAYFPLETTPVIVLSIKEVVQTLLEAIALVFLVMLVFLQNLRATLIPTIAVPVVLLGTFAVLYMTGFTINTLTMLAMVLAIGLLVDDAIVVVENVERVMQEEKLDPREATRKSMDQISGALIGIAVVLSAVFLPMAFFSGSTGVIYRQFAITVVVAMGLSVATALIFTPALCATLLKPHDEHAVRHRRFRPGLWFNRGFDRTRGFYDRSVGLILSASWLAVLAFLGMVALLTVLYLRLPGGFLPDEDQGIAFAQVVMPPGTSAEDTTRIADRIVQFALTDQKDAVDGAFRATGFSFAGTAQSAAFVAVKLKDWDKRGGGATAQSVAAAINRHFEHYNGGRVFALIPPAVMELGNVTGFDFELQDEADLGHEKLMQARNMLLSMAARDPVFAAVYPNGLDDAPEFKLDIDRQKSNALGISITDVNTAIQGLLGSVYVNQFTRAGRTKDVYIQAESDARMTPEALDQFYVRNGDGTMVPFSAFASGSWTLGPQKLERYNGSSSIELQGAPSPGHSTGEAMTEMVKLVHRLPKGIGYSWTGMSYEQQASAGQPVKVYAVAMIVVLLALAALYESWAIPLSVILVVPLGVLGAVIAALLRGMNNDIYFQVGLLTTIGLATKNAILIVEFARDHYANGSSLIDAVRSAASERLRPILMTSLAFVLGVLPLTIATGAGAGGRRVLGTAVVGGMLTATFLAILFVPVFFVVVLRLFRVQGGAARPAECRVEVSA